MGTRGSQTTFDKVLWGLAIAAVPALTIIAAITGPTPSEGSPVTAYARVTPLSIKVEFEQGSGQSFVMVDETDTQDMVMLSVVFNSYNPSADMSDAQLVSTTITLNRPIGDRALVDANGVDIPEVPLADISPTEASR